MMQKELFEVTQVFDGGEVTVSMTREQAKGLSKELPSTWTLREFKKYPYIHALRAAIAESIKGDSNGSIL